MCLVVSPSLLLRGGVPANLSVSLSVTRSPRTPPPNRGFRTSRRLWCNRYGNISASTSGCNLCAPRFPQASCLTAEAGPREPSPAKAGVPLRIGVLVKPATAVSQGVYHHGQEEG
ncbi:unnamed protein product [Ectocarpus fasciculatus]